MNNFIPILESLERHEVEYAIVGGFAAVLHGAPVLTFDIDALIRVTEDNAARLLRVFAELQARYRGHPTPLEPVREDILAGRHLLLRTRLGPFDVLGVLGKGTRYDEVAAQLERFEVAGLSVPVLGLEELIRQKRALGRDKDLVALRMLEEVARQRGIDPGG